MSAPTSVWTPLLPVAMVGTARHAGAMPSWPGPVGEAIAGLAAVAREAAGPERVAADVLRAAAVLATCERAAALPSAASPGSPPAAQELAPFAAGQAFESLLDWVLREAPQRLQLAVLASLGEAGLRLPHALLPVALELSRRSLELRAVVAPVLGERGLWLARQHEGWQFAAGAQATTAADDPRQWSEGSLEQRRAFLVRERLRDPAAARDRFVAALADMGARERAELARSMEAALSLDEPMLDRLRTDRARDVQAVALELLLRLPGAAHPARAAQRLAGLLREDPAASGHRWSIEPPTAAGADWKADQVDATVPRGGSLGERAWWLYQIARQVPLAWWTRHLGMSVAEVAAWADAGEWAEALWTAWRDVLMHAPDPVWAEALLEIWPVHADGATRWRVLGRDDLVFAAVSPAARERYLARCLDDRASALSHHFSRLLAVCGPGGTLPSRLSAILLPRLRAVLNPATAAGDVQYESVGRWLPELCCVLPLADVADLDTWPVPPDESQGVAASRVLALRIVRTRRALQNLLA